MAATCGSTFSKSTSPEMPPFASSQLMPTSMTTWSGFVYSVVTLCSCPDAAIRMSASLVMEGTSAVRVWQLTTVAFSCISIMATGRPMTRERPMTAAFFPETGMSKWCRISMAAWAVQGGNPVFVLVKTPASDRSVQPSMSLAGSSICLAFSLSSCPGRGRNRRIPWMLSSSLTCRKASSKASWVTSAGSTTFFTSTPAVSARFVAPRS